MMPYQHYLHRRFDIQLSPVAASIIDWAPPSRDAPAVSDVSSSFPSSGEGKTTSENGGRKKPFRDWGQKPDDAENFARSSQLMEGGPYATESGAAASSEAGLKPHSSTAPLVSDRGSREARSCHKTAYLRLSQSHWTVNSYAATSLLSRGTFSLNAGLFSDFGVALGAASSAVAWPSPTPQSVGRLCFYATDTFQLECIWRRMQWAGAVKLFGLWPSTALPVCELTGVTPRTDWCVQADRLLFNWSWFWRIFVRDERSCRWNSLISQNSPAEPPPASEEGLDTCGTTAAKNAPPPTKWAAASPSHRYAASARQDEKHHPQPRAVQSHHEGSLEKATAAFAVEDEIAYDDDRGEMRGGRGRLGAKALNHDVGKSPLHTTSGEENYRWWSLKELRCGAGFAVKNDLASGVNVYCGCSGHFGRALTVSTHVDVLHRACCSITSNTKSLDLAARLRMNLITWHRTELDAGLGWRPFKQVPGLTCRLSRSMGRTSAGITIRDIGTQYNKLLSSRHAKREEHAAQQGREGQLQQRQHGRRDPQGNLRGIASNSTTSTAWSFSDWYDPYIRWMWRLGRSITGSASLAASSAAASSATGAITHGPGLRKRFSQAMLWVIEYADALFRQTEFDLTMGLEEQRHHSRRLRCFFVLSAH
ncbi:hypothetical protein TraAM80_05641 [Trypanosoma rangeli]|uniref:Uncharacterized protein n=1 Tax=Trypanosoma rangeli TaxID=5698 RepID=A0A422ND91_TRYRA|nr:uncharacterized protein TraAM80_05641 [Trypanosoma rangeli]RNF03480.1 hypothetical protein TraAM80_05641 [Trypanosoma rangeli]|eukprot:RNF03480.1 hypothetical protein TraAM80_05641 [Trypanosoma rangeli]